MKLGFSALSVIVLVCAGLVLSSCDSAMVGWGRRPRYGPPPHAPAHGYRHKHHGVELAYDSGRGLYVVVGFPNHFYYGGHFYRYQSTRWEVSTHIAGSWKPVSGQFVPPGLRAKKKAKEHPGRGRGTRKSK